MATIWGGSVFYGGLLGGHPGGRCIPAPEGAALGPLGQPDSPGHPPSFMFLAGSDASWADAAMAFPLPGALSTGTAPVAEANGVSRFPVQLVEAAWNLVLFLLLARLQRRGRDRLLPLYLALYAPARFLLEFLRGDAYRGIFLGLSTSQWISLFLFPRRSVCPASPQELTKISHPPLFLPGDLWYTEGQKPENLQGGTILC